MWQRLFCLFMLIVFTAIHRSASAHNGAVVYALPVSNITLDGNLDEWPDHLPVYTYGSADGTDLRVTFRVGFDPAANALYVAMHTIDDTVITQGTTGQPWNAQDSCDLFIDVFHAPGSTQPSQFFQRAEPGAYPVDRAAAFKLARTVTNKSLTYEWRIDLGVLSGGKFRAEFGKVIGFDTGTADRDSPDDTTGYQWGPMDGTNKWQDSSLLGDLIFANKMSVSGVATGRLDWSDDRHEVQKSEVSGFPLVRLQPESLPDTSYYAYADESGRYTAMLPAATYTVSSVDTLRLRVDESKATTAVVQPGQITRAEPLTVTPLGEPIDLTDPHNQAVLLRDEIDTDQIDNFIETYMKHQHIPGMSLALIKNSRVVYKRTYGVKSVLTGEPVKTDTLFEAASMTKPLLGYTVSRLVERGVIDLDKPLAEYLPHAPRFADIESDPRHKLITPRIVLAHRTGFPNWRSGNPLKIGFTPGTDYGYSGEGFDYLTRIVEHLTGKPISQVIDEEVFTPFGMRNAYLTGSPQIAPRFATGHINGDNPTERGLNTEASMAYSLHTDAGTYARFQLAILNRQGMSQPSFDEFLRPQFPVTGEDEESFGLGIVSKQTPLGKMFGHGGSNTGFTSNSEVYDDLKVGYVFLINSDQAEAVVRVLDPFLITGRYE